LFQVQVTSLRYLKNIPLCQTKCLIYKTLYYYNYLTEVMVKKSAFVILILVLFIFWGCKKSDDTGKMNIVTTIFPLYDYDHSSWDRGSFL
jgi:hypothetical protein